MISDIASPPDHLDSSAMPARPSALDRLRAVVNVPRRWALALILLLAAFANFYQLQQEGYANLYYAAAIRSMLQSWHNFFFVSFDPGGFVTVDKPPLGFWIQTASAKLLGYSGFSILLPEALAGIASVGVLYVLVRRLFGTPAGLLAALFLAITPISVVTNRNNTIDSLLVLTVLLAAYAVSRAVERGSLRWLLLCAVLVGLGFNIKMLEAYLVVPALAAVYLLGAPLGWWKRLWHLAVAGAALLAVSLSWVLAVDLTPASARPYVASSGSNSELALALGYNGIQRLLGHLFGIPAQVSKATASVATTVRGGVGSSGENGAVGVFRLLNAQLGGQASWLLALGLIGMLATGWGFRPGGFLRALPGSVRAWRDSATARRAAHLTPRQSALVLWGLWMLTMAAFFSVAGFFHHYYLSMLAPSIAALAGIGIVLLWRDYYADRSSGWRSWLLPAAFVVTALTQAVILTDYSGWNTWMTPLIVGGSLIVAAVLLWYLLIVKLAADHLDATVPAPLASSDISTADGVDSIDGDVEFDPPLPQARPHVRLPRWAYAPLVATALGMAVLLVGPVMWTGISLVNGGGGTLPSAGPSAGLAFSGRIPSGAVSGGSKAPEGFPPEGFESFAGPSSRNFPGGVPGGGFSAAGGPGFASGKGANGDGSQVDSQLLAYLEAHQGSAKYLFATDSTHTAEPYIIATGKPVMALGGFSGADQILTLSQLQTLIRQGQVKYFLLSSGGFGGTGGDSGNGQLIQWIEAHATPVPASAYGGSSAGGQLYVISASAANS